jgi:hemolysin III
MQSHTCVQTGSSGEEWVNSATHGFGAILAIIGTYFLIDTAVLYGGEWKILSASLYGFSAFFALFSSAIFHGTMTTTLKRKFRILDHAAIYIMIAGGYSPLLLIPLQHESGIVLFSLIWFFAIAGVLWKIFYFGISETISIASYLLMGWVGLFILDSLFNTVPTDGLLFMLAGGVCYTTGIFFYINDHKKYYHAIWHISVLLGSICHYIAVLKFILPIPCS